MEMGREMERKREMERETDREKGRVGKEHKRARETETDRNGQMEAEAEGGDAEIKDRGREMDGAVQWRVPEVATLVPPLQAVPGSPSPPLTCLGQGSSGTARLGDSVLPERRQEESQAAKLLLHLLVGDPQ